MKKFLYQPIFPFIINQPFGANRACYVPSDLSRPVITCDGNNPPEGYVSLYGPGGHKGVDLAAHHGQEVYCSQRGVVNAVDANPKSGLDVRIVSEIDGVQYRHIYEHLLGYQHKIGDTVETGQLVGWADNTGWSSGDHLHFQLEQWIPTADIGGGTWVAIDPMPFMELIFAKDILKINNSLKYIAEQIALLADRIADYLRRNKKVG